MEYVIYNPDITVSQIVDTYDNPSGLTYVSNSSLEYWEHKYWAIMDGTTEGLVEGATGQQIWLATSEDGVTWTAAYQPFRDSSRCTNPVSGSDIEWQPNLVVVGTELWCTWWGADAYVSKLSTVSGKWTNYRFEFVDDDQVFISDTVTGAATVGRALRPTIDSISDWQPFFSQNPITLSTGVVACPLTFYSAATMSTQTTATSTFTRSLKHNALITWNGTDWGVIYIDTSDFGDFCAWEPFVVEDGSTDNVYVYSRNLDARADDEDFLLVSTSSDRGVTFGASVSTKMLVPSTRGFARKVSDSRWIMTHVDHPQLSDNNPDTSVSGSRVNGAIFVSRRGRPDFVPGINFSGADPSMNYPQFIVGPDDKLRINYTSGTGIGARRALRMVTVDPIPSDTVAYVHPRSVNLYNSSVTDPELVTGSPAYYGFNGQQQIRSTTTLTASTGVTYAAWFRFEYGSGSVVMDSRVSTTGQELTVGGFLIRSLTFNHGFSLQPEVVTFVAAVLDNSAQTVTIYGCNGGSMSTKVCYFKSITFAGQPANLDTIDIDGTTYTFKTTAAVTNDVAIGASTAATITNLAAAVASGMETMTVGSTGLMMTREDLATFAVDASGSSQITVDTSIALNAGTISVGSKALEGSLLTPLVGRVYESRVYDSALSSANVTYLYDNRVSDFGYTALGGGSAPGDPLVYLNPASPDTDEWPPLGTDQPAYCETVGTSTLRIHGEASAAVELPYAVTELVIGYSLGAAPTGTEKYVIASFGTVAAPTRLYVDAANPTSLYANNSFVASVTGPTAANTVTVTVYSNKITIGGSFEMYFDGKPRCYLGNAFGEGLLTVDEHIDFDVSAMSCAKVVA